MNSQSTRLPRAVILAGGKSQRFGHDKATVNIAGQPLILRLRDQLLAAGHEVSCVADRADRYLALGLDCLVDAQTDSGPLAGLAAALENQQADQQVDQLADQLAAATQHDQSPWVLLISCDQVQWVGMWSEQLCGALASTGAAMSAVVFASEIWQPLPGLYHIDLLAEVRERLRQRQLSLHGLLEACHQRGRCLTVEVEDPPSRWTFNTRSELDRLLVELKLAGHYPENRNL